MIPKIVGGHPAPQHTWSWVVSLNDTDGHFCGGSILNEWYIITAAHCFDEKMDSLSNITICAGTHYLSDPCRQRRVIENLIKHPEYRKATFENDIALIRVTARFKFSDKLIARVCLPTAIDKNKYPRKGTDVITVGWGATERAPKSDALQQVIVKVEDKSNKNCDSAVHNHTIQLCATAPGKDACFGDSGGPLMVFKNKSKTWELVGITSYGINGCATIDPGIYTRITAFLSFIHKTINNTPSKLPTMKCSCQCPEGFDQGFAYTTVNSTKACVDACKAVPATQCTSSNTYACLRTNCIYSTNYSVTNNSRNISVVTLSNGDRYEGEFKHDKKHGKGTMTYANGNKYNGSWIHDEKGGYGVFTWPNRDRYEMDCS